MQQDFKCISDVQASAVQANIFSSLTEPLRPVFPPPMVLEHRQIGQHGWSVPDRTSIDYLGSTGWCAIGNSEKGICDYKGDVVVVRMSWRRDDCSSQSSVEPLVFSFYNASRHPRGDARPAIITYSETCLLSDGLSSCVVSSQLQGQNFIQTKWVSYT